VLTLRRARKQHLSNLMSEISNLPPPNPGGISLSLFLVYVPPPSPPLPQMAAQLMLNAETPCLLLNPVPNPTVSVPTLPSHTHLSLDSVSFSPDMVESLLSTLKSDSATSPDGISRHVLKTCCAALAQPLSVLFTLSFAQGHLPSEIRLYHRSA